MSLADQLREQADRSDHLAMRVELLSAHGKERAAAGRTAGERRFDADVIAARYRERSALLRLAAEAFAWTDKHTCPRRSEVFQQPGNGNDDRWSSGHGLVHQARGCSYCGSMHPDDFMAAVRAGDFVGPTDKSYKAYLNAAPTEDDIARHRERAERTFADVADPDDRAKLIAGLASEPVMGASIGKFYYQHLSLVQRREFVGLYNDGTMKIGYPGYFYVNPFFMIDAPKDSP